MRTIDIGALNFSMPLPHSPARYVQFLRDAHALRRPIGLRGSYQALIGGMWSEMKDDGETSETIVQGNIYKYFNIDATADWFNVLKSEPADEGEKNSIRIPEHLKPHFQQLPFVFMPESHRMFVVLREGRAAISVGAVQRFFDVLSQQNELLSKYGRVEVTAEQSEEGLREVLRIPRLGRLTITLKRPNADDLREEEKAVMDRLSRQQAREQVIEYTADRNVSLKPDRETRVLARVARSNGSVVGVGQEEDGKRVERSTTRHPFTEKQVYEPKSQNVFSALAAKAREMLGAILQSGES